MRRKHANYSQCGATIIETSLVLMPLLLLGALMIELTHSQQVRQLAQLALYEAARAGSTSGTHLGRINQSFSEAILPLYAARGIHQTPADRRDKSEKNIMRETGLIPWEIQVLNPNVSVFKDFSHPGLSKKFGRATLRNDYLAEQHQEKVQKGWHEGRGPLSGQTVFEANTLGLQLSLIYTPVVSGTRFVLKILSGSRTDRTGIAWSKGYLVANLLTEVMMQSHAQHGETTPHTEIAKQPHSIKQLINHTSHLSAQTDGEPTQGAGPQKKSGQRLKVFDAEHVSNMSRQVQVLNNESASADLRGEDNNICNGLVCCQ